MNAPDNPSPPLKLLAARTQDSRFTILLVGSTAMVYTASTTNPLSNTKILHVDTGSKGIIEVIIWDRFINDLPCRIITLPELGNIERDASLTQACINALKISIMPVQCIWFAAQLSETKLSQNEQNVIKWVTMLLSEQAWRYAIVVLTYSNSIKDRWKRADMMKNTSEKVRAEISKYTGWDIAGNITSVPITTLDDIILDGKKWLPEFYEQVAHHSHSDIVSTSSDIRIATENLSSLEKGDSVETNISPSKGHELTWCYITSAPMGAIGMALYGYWGFAIGLVTNILFWIICNFVRRFLSRSRIGSNLD